MKTHEDETNSFAQVPPFSVVEISSFLDIYNLRYEKHESNICGRDVNYAFK